MAIGLGLGAHKSQIQNDPSWIDGLVLWYDFSNETTMCIDRNGTVPVTANNDQVRWARNIANGDANGNILGNFARSEAVGSQYGGIFRTGGINGQSYVQFAETNADNSHGLRSGFIAADATVDGGVATNKFSDVTLDVDNLTIIQILKHDDAVIENNDVSFFVNGYAATGGDTSSCMYISQKMAGDEKFSTGYVFISGGLDIQASVANDTLDTNVHAMVTRSRSGTNNMTLQVDGVVQTDTDTPGDRTMKFDRSTGIPSSLSGSAFYSIGGSFQTGTMIKSWQGAIYETIVYNRFLSDDELASLEVYFTEKYGITFS